jgi:hypothetical protein
MVRHEEEDFSEQTALHLYDEPPAFVSGLFGEKQLITRTFFSEYITSTYSRIIGAYFRLNRCRLTYCSK